MLPISPDTSTAGKGLTTTYNAHCEYSCKFGYCPIHLCSYTAVGHLNTAVLGGQQIPQLWEALTLEQRDLYDFVFSHGFTKTDDNGACVSPLPTSTSTRTTSTLTPTPTPTAQVDILF
ncbi:hypothetical protein BX600DRAFT_441813 [Xylariales sp. PMI_506]|nr:hypothetical protein BX600DRAFT_441813 [Xylariales sp. PMI_506]